MSDQDSPARSRPGTYSPDASIIAEAQSIALRILGLTHSGINHRLPARSALRGVQALADRLLCLYSRPEAER